MSTERPEDDTLELTGLDRAMVAFLQAVQPSPDPLHGELAARVSHQFGLGHACLDLNTLPSSLRQSGASLPWIEGANSPLVRDGERLYLRRNWAAEQSIRASIATRLAQPCPIPANLSESLVQLFEPSGHSAAPDWQKVACALAARKRFSLITGGPGTGKTTTVVRLLALLQADPARQQAPLRIALAAPTGKAAARLGESIASALQKLPVAMQQHIPTQAVTLHKLLQVRSNLAQDAVPELAVDLVVVDEASMIDLEMMARLLAAVPLSASLILLGDKDQLASVEAGAVMGQLCSGADLGRYSPDTLAWLAQATGADLSAWAGDGSPLAQQTVMLRLSHRFADNSGIGQWARAVNAGDSASVARLWQQAPTWHLDAHDSVTRLQPGQAHDPRLQALVQHGWQAWLQQLEPFKNSACSDAQALAALHAFASFQVLCAVRDGPWGVASLNQHIAASLGLAGAGWYAGRPVMVTRNDYALKLMNGDIGLCLNHANGLRVAFADGQGGVRWVLPARLDAVETVFAMTVHKSQGSEFDHVALVLPERPVAVLTRELLYTGITRARSRLTLVVPQAEVLLRAVGIKVLRSGGLADL
ncbi:MAG: exodeoxyribonuclease V subunit alpha [Betaproteobacteria bacterium HGW-Betaproteobacteria-18]|nr:MAG: exodeoxyribonuclease V subunit alpha [Betaproteobacteria bacterium HGW-Betaproteobacteria-18]